MRSQGPIEASVFVLRLQQDFFKRCIWRSLFVTEHDKQSCRIKRAVLTEGLITTSKSETRCSDCALRYFREDITGRGSLFLNF